jgi:hypothetical protein
MGWDWTDQAHSDAQRRGLEDAMEGNLAGAFEEQAIADATERPLWENRQRPERPLWVSGLRARGDRQLPQGYAPSSSGIRFRLALLGLAILAIGIIALVH